MFLFDADGTLLDSLPPHVDFCHVSRRSLVLFSNCALTAFNYVFQAMNNKYCEGKLSIPPRTDGRLVHASPMDNFLRRFVVAPSRSKLYHRLIARSLCADVELVSMNH